MKIIFISQPFKGKSISETDRIRAAAKEKLYQKFGEDILFVSVSDLQREEDDIRALGECIKRLANADLLYMCKGWEESRGCSIERRVAILYEIPIEYER